MASTRCPQNCCLLFVLLFHGVNLGFLFSVLGPCLPDLQCLYNVDLSVASSLFIFFCLGGVSVQALSASLLQRFSSPFPLMCAIVLVQAVAYFGLPFAGTIYVAAFVVFVTGLTTYFGLSAILYVFQINWPGNFRIVHLVFAMSAIGSVVGPLLANPFLSDGKLTQEYGSDLWHLTGHIRTGRMSTNVFKKESVPQQLYHQQISSEPNVPKSPHFLNGPTSTVTPSHHQENNITLTNMYTLDTECQDFITIIHFPYMLISFIHLPPLLGYFYFSFNAQFRTEASEYESFDNNESLKRANIIYLIFIFLFLIQSQGLTSGFSALLTTYGMKHVHLSMSKMALMTSLLWGFFTISRLLVILFPSDFNQVYIVTTSMIGTSVGMVILTSTVYGNEVTLWVACIILGFFSGPFVSASLSWSDQVVGSTPKIKSLLIVAVLVGFLVPSLVGLIMEMYGVTWFVYFFIAFQLFNLAIFIILLVLIKCMNKQVSP